MSKDEEAKVAERSSGPYQVKLPGFVIDAEVGLGDLVKRVSYAFGVTPCGGCDRRATVLNRWIVFTK